MAESSVSSIPIIVSLAPIVVGIGSQFVTPFLESREGFRSRAQLIKETILEKLSIKLSAVFTRFKNIWDTDETLRGDGAEVEDPISEFIGQSYKKYHALHSIDTLQNKLVKNYQLLLAGSVCGVILLFGYLFNPFDTAHVLLISGIIIFAQICAIFQIFNTSSKLDELDDSQ